MASVKSTPHKDKKDTETKESDDASHAQTETKEDSVNIPNAYAYANKDHRIDIDNLNLSVESTEDWKIFQRIGRGKYSEVFEGKNMKSGLTACVKILKPCLPKLLKLEIYVLQLLKNGPNIIQLLHTLKDDKSNLWCLVFEILKCKELKDLLKTLNANDLKHYMYETLKGLDYAHAKGVIHRDIKPQNILIDIETKKLRLIDWGLAAFYYPNHQYSVRVATRAYKAPELLVEHQYYHYAVDIWAFGCMFGGILFGKNYFFHGKDFPEQLEKIIECLGTKRFDEFINKYKIKVPAFVNDYPEYKGRKWRDYIDGKTNKKFIDEDALDLLDKVLRYDPNERLTAKQAMNHRYFDQVRGNNNNNNQMNGHSDQQT